MNKDINRNRIDNLLALQELIRCISYLESELTKLTKSISEQNRTNPNPNNDYAHYWNSHGEALKELLEHDISNRKKGRDRLLEEIQSDIRSSIEDPEELSLELERIHAGVATLAKAYDALYSNSQFDDEGYNSEDT